MKVKMCGLSAGPNGVLDADAVVDLPEAKAKELVAGLHAVAVEPETRVTHKWPHGLELSNPPKGAK